ncbi:MAG: hypothetical protein ABI625_13760 [bacterium]
MHDDDMKFDEFLRQGAKDYKTSVAPPADAIWSAIEADVAKAIAPKSKSRSFAALRMTAGPLRTTTWIGLGLAATLVIGVGVGRWTARTSNTPAPIAARARTTTADSAGNNSHARAVTLDHLADAEVFLTSVRAELKSGQTDTERAERSRDLLVRTRVLLGSSRNRTPEVERLLEDLELLLAEIAVLPQSHSSLDRTLLDESMRSGNIIPRIRATLPARAAGA